MTLYHGTSIRFDDGTILRPVGPACWVWLTDDPIEARLWAEWACRRHGGDTAYVYEAVPIGPSFEFTDWVRCRKARVVTFIESFAADPHPDGRVMAHAVGRLTPAFDSLQDSMKVTTRAVANAYGLGPLRRLRHPFGICTGPSPWKPAHAKQYRRRR